MRIERWRTHVNQQDTFDARQRPWFTESIASSKDLLILVDVQVFFVSLNSSYYFLIHVICVAFTGAGAYTDRLLKF